MAVSNQQSVISIARRVRIGNRSVFAWVFPPPTEKGGVLPPPLTYRSLNWKIVPTPLCSRDIYRPGGITLNPAICWRCVETIVQCIFRYDCKIGTVLDHVHCSIPSGNVDAIRGTRQLKHRPPKHPVTVSDRSVPSPSWY